MVERKSLMLKALSFSGIFNIQELYSAIDDFFKSKGYDRLEKLNEEIVDEKGRQVTLKLFPYKKTSDYTKNVIKIIAQFKDIQDVAIEEDGKRKAMHKGHAKISLEAYFETDYEGKMVNRPFYFFMRELVDRFVYRIYLGKAEAILLEDMEHLRILIKNYFNMHA